MFNVIAGNSGNESLASSCAELIKLNKINVMAVISFLMVRSYYF
jgi:hypothetical protein